jgi:hypothetical protein
MITWGVLVGVTVMVTGATSFGVVRFGWRAATSNIHIGRPAQPVCAAHQDRLSGFYEKNVSHRHRAAE